MKGLESAFARLDSFVAKVDRITTEGVKDAAESILAEAKTLAPVDTGRMVGEAAVRHDGDKSQVVFPTHYAVYVHENMEARHTNGQAKFLITALNNRRVEYFKSIRDRIRGIS